jgi:thiol-disulfide isomerase/thioredoxin
MRSILVLALLVVVASAASAPAESSALPFVANDYSGALARAKSQKRPLFVEFWAPWCHTCRSMRAFVFTDETLTNRAGQFVWLEIDTDLPASEAVVSRFPVDAWPTFRVLDPETERVILERVGSLTVAQVHAFLDEAQVAFAGKTGASPADKTLAEADRLAGQRKYAEAALAYRTALDASPPSWPPLVRAMEAELWAHQAAQTPDRCALRAVEHLRRLATESIAARLSVAGTGLQCALDSPPQTPLRSGWIASLEPMVTDLLSRPGIDLAADDISGFYMALATARQQASDETGRRSVLMRWVAFLEATAESARTAEQRAVFDSHRMSAYLEIGEPDRARIMLEASERNLPKDYNPPARLAVIFQALGRWNDALAASDRALGLVEGPRRLRILRVKAEVQESNGDVAGALTTLELAVTFARTLENGEKRALPLVEKIEALRRAKAPVRD